MEIVNGHGTVNSEARGAFFQARLAVGSLIASSSLAPSHPARVAAELAANWAVHDVLAQLVESDRAIADHLVDDATLAAVGPRVYCSVFETTEVDEQYMDDSYAANGSQEVVVRLNLQVHGAIAAGVLPAALYIGDNGADLDFFEFRSRAKE